MLQLVASDMDGTLLSTQLTISKENRQAIALLEQHRIPFVICTGRNYEQARVCLEPYQITCPIIALNGSQTYNQHGQLVESITIPHDVAATCIAAITQAQFHWEAVTNEGLYTNNLAERFTLLTNWQKKINPHITDEELQAMATKYHTLLNATETPQYQTMLANETVDIYKISCFHQDGPNAFIDFRRYLSETLPELVATSSNSDNLEINHRLAQKGLALKRYADHHGYEMSRILAIGDNGNDRSMLQLAGYSYAMANAEEEIKQVAKFLTASNDQSGVAKAIHKQLYHL